MFRSLWFRLTGTVLGLVIFTLALALVSTLIIASRQVTEFINNTSNEIISITGPADMLNGTTDPSGIQINSGQPGTIDLTDQNGDGLTISSDGVKINGGNGDGVIISQNGLEINPGNSEALTLTQDVGPLLTQEQQISQIEVQIPEIVQSQSAQLARDVANTLLTAVSVSLFLAMVVGTWLFWQITRPLTRLRDAAEKIATGKLETRVVVKSKDEVGRVGLAFNHMAGQLQRQEGLRKQMVADIAHELRTPLSVMQVNLEAMSDELLPTSPEELDGLHNEVLRLSRLVEDLRLLSLADSGNLELVNEEVDVNDLVETAVRRLKPQAESRGIVLSASLARQPIMVMGDEDKLHQVLANLVSNSLRFTPSGKGVDVRVQTAKQWVTIEVCDEGPGIDSADLPFLFERFFKGDKSRTRVDGGSGLGLSIVKQLVELHGGTIEAALPESGGLLVTIQLPAGKA